MITHRQRSPGTTEGRIMAFIKTLNIWAPGVQDKILSGEIKLQRGQWLECGENATKKCRYIGHNGTTINVVHWQGSTEATNTLFQMRLRAAR